MPDVSDIRKQVETRIKELERLIEPLHAEYEQLKNAASAFESGARARLRGGRAAAQTTTKAAKRSARGASGRRRGRPRGSGGRSQQALSFVTKQPGITIAELGRQMGISPNYLYRVLPQLEKDGKVKKQGKGYHPV
jgi:predicted Rossmann fold nucleotide-binding protein DprA/Smf involved in DNA uptake